MLFRSRALEDGFHEKLGPFDRQVQLGPQCSMLNEGPAPMTAHMAGIDGVPPAMEVGGDKGENVQRDAIGGDERVPPLANGRQGGRSILVELRNRVEGEPVWK